MVRIEGDLVIARPIEDVFDFVADECHEPRYNPRIRAVEKLTEGEIGAGTMFRAETASRGRVVPMTIELTAHERPRRLASTTCMPGMDIAGQLEFASDPAGTRMCWRWDMRPRGVLRLLTPLLGPLGRRQEEANWAALKRYPEQPAPSL